MKLAIAIFAALVLFAGEVCAADGTSAKTPQLQRLKQQHISMLFQARKAQCLSDLPSAKLQTAPELRPASDADDSWRPYYVASIEARDDKTSRLHPVLSVAPGAHGEPHTLKHEAQHQREPISLGSEQHGVTPSAHAPPGDTPQLNRREFIRSIEHPPKFSSSISVLSRA